MKYSLFGKNVEKLSSAAVMIGALRAYLRIEANFKLLLQEQYDLGLYIICQRGFQNIILLLFLAGKCCLLIISATYSKTCLKWPLKNRQNKDLNGAFCNTFDLH